MLSRVPRFLIALALAGSIGLHWAFLQAIAWAGMVITYSHDASLSEAVVKTFDGKHPCVLCKQIAKGKQSERKPDIKFDSGKLEFPFVPVVFQFIAPSYFWQVTGADNAVHSLTHAPPRPPPRNFCCQGPVAKSIRAAG